MEALKPIHCSPTSRNNEPILNGMFSTIVNECSLKNIQSLIAKSATCCKKIIPKMVKNKVKEYESSKENMIRSVTLFYKGGILTKRKYKEMRKRNESFMSEVSIPKPVSYDRLIAFINSIDMGEVVDLQVM